MPLTFSQQLAFAHDALETFVLCHNRASPHVVQQALDELVYFTVRVCIASGFPVLY